MGGNEKQLRAFVGEGRLKPEEEEGMRQAWPPPPVREKLLSVCRGGLRVGGNGTSTGLSRLLQKERERTKLCVGGVWETMPCRKSQWEEFLWVLFCFFLPP